MAGKGKKVEAVAYIRTSSAANVGADKDSDKRQRATIEGYAKRAGFALVGEFNDAAVSGADPIETRPGFAALLDRIEDNGVRTVIVEDASRFARELVTQELGILALIKRGVRVLTANGDDLTDSSDPSRKMMRQIAGSFAEYEKARLVAKLKAARERKRLTTGKCEGRKSHAEMAPEMVQIAKGLRRRKRGNSLRAIAAELAARGYRQRQRQGVLSGLGGLNAGRLRLGPIFEAIFLAQRLGLLGEAERGERICGDAGGVPGPGVVRTIDALVRRQRSPGELQRFCRAIRHQQQPCIMALVPPRERMFGAECLVAHGDGAKEERLGLVRLTKVPEQASEVVEARRRVRMLGAKHLLPDRQRALMSGRAPARSPWPAAGRRGC